MTTITMDIDEATFARAEQKAAAMATSVSEVVATYLRNWAGDGQLREAQALMQEKFANPDWRFGVGTPDNREQRNART